MNELHLFAGAGGGILGGLLLGHRPVCAVEIEEYPRKVLLQRQRDGILPKFPIWDDVSTFDGNPWRGKVDVVCGGFPCQDISAAANGKGGGIDGKRSGLWAEMHRIICEIRPRYAFMENSPIITSRGLGRVLGDLAEIGYNCRWSCFTGYEVGAPCKRERWFCVTEDSRADKEPGEHPKPDMLNKALIKDKLWGAEVFSALLERDKERMPIISRDERVVNGLPHTVDRLSAIGNAQIPAVAALAWQTLKIEQY